MCSVEMWGPGVLLQEDKRISCTVDAKNEQISVFNMNQNTLY